jgi:hypothetical protein
MKPATGRSLDRVNCSKGKRRFFARPGVYPVDVRGVVYSYAYFSPKHLDATGGSFCLLTIADKDGQPLEGGTPYRLTVPANAPIRQYWSATVYDRATHAPIRKCPAGPAARPRRPKEERRWIGGCFSDFFASRGVRIWTLARVPTAVPR